MRGVAQFGSAPLWGSGGRGFKSRRSDYLSSSLIRDLYNLKELNKKNLGLIETEIKMIDCYFYAEQYHQHYLASAGSRQYCSASPTKVKLGVFAGSNYKLEDHIWENFNWEVDKCVLRSDNNPIKTVSYTHLTLPTILRV